MFLLTSVLKLGWRTTGTGAEVKEEGKDSSHATRAVGSVKYPVTISFLWICCIPSVNVRHTMRTMIGGEYKAFLIFSPRDW